MYIYERNINADQRMADLIRECVEEREQRLLTATGEGDHVHEVGTV